jgi:alanine racemase
VSEVTGQGLTTWIEVSSEAIRHNLGLFRDLVSPGTRLLAVVKANAYGHGLVEVSRVCLAAGVHMLGVHSADEVAALRRAGIGAPLLVMGYLTPERIADVVDPLVHVLASSNEVVEALAGQARRLGVPLPVHVKIDTGTHRQGVAVEDVAAFAAAALHKGLAVVGVATHFANIEDTTDHSYAFSQLERFRAGVVRVREEVGDLEYVHAACSAAALLFREADFTMARLGISLYGHWPSRETYVSWLIAHEHDSVRLRPVLSWRVRVGQVKEIGTDEPIGYGLTYRPTRPTRVAVLPVGYADGYPRALSNRARVLLRGRQAPVVGRVCMDIVMADVTDIPGVREGDVATLIGSDGTSRVAVEDLAEIAGTINYELLSRLSPLLARVVV